MIYDQKKLEAAGFRITETHEGGVVIVAPQMKVGQFVPIKDGKLQLFTRRSAFHREIAVALGDADAANAGPPA